MQQKIQGVGARQRPALAVFKGVLYMAWKGVGNDPIFFLQHVRTKEDGRLNSTYRTSAQATDPHWLCMEMGCTWRGSGAAAIRASGGVAPWMAILGAAKPC